MSSVESKFTINPVHDVLYVDLKGTWDPEQTQLYAAEFKRQVSRYFAREWACIWNLKELDMLLAEETQIALFKALNTWSYIKGMKAGAVIISVDNRDHLLYQVEEIFKGVQPFATTVCHSELEANHWLVEQGFSERLLERRQRTA